MASVYYQALLKIVCVCWVISVLVVCTNGKKAVKCSICKDIVANFHKGLSKTAKSNYGGGNTKWEEKSLGSYANSETRLVEIIEQLCEDSKKECHSVLEEHEEMIENFWFKEFGQKKNTDLHEFLCIRNMKACCHNNTYGKDCSPCPGGEKRPCGGNGACDGEGTREGTGKCKCNAGYQGDLCNECKDGYFEESKNDSNTLCKVCHISCKNICSEGGPQGCDECKSGWLPNEELGCQDVNECEEEPCEENQYCTNTQGSYSCFTCDKACIACTGSGPAKCTECNAGFILDKDSRICEDIDECEIDSSLCTAEHQECKNVPGSHECLCAKGFVMKDGTCEPAPKDDENTEGSDSDEKQDTEKDEL